MRILYICHRLPYPPKRGGKIRPFNMIRHLSAKHEVTVCSLARSEQEAAEGAGLAQHCARVEVARVSDPMQWVRMFARLPTVVPSSMGFFWSPDLAVRIRHLLSTERFDLIFVHCSSVAQFVSDVQGIPKILDFGDMDSQKWLEYAQHKPLPLKPGYWIEGTKLEREERRLARMFDLCTATTRAEWETLESYATGAPTGWFPNGVDAETFAPEDGAYDADTLSFIGRMDYYPNHACMIDFCAQVWPLLKKRRPGMKLLIVGADPSAAVRSLGELPGVTVTGSVPDVRPYVRGSLAMVAPLSIARGTQNKLLEAMAMGVPVVCSRVAAAGVDAVPGEHLLVADTPSETAASVLRLIERPEERARLALAGRARMLTHHSWPKSMERLDALIAGCMARFNQKLTADSLP
jgi:sugar transferase (PEP-CTERM/EpsH1 system associated)